MHITLHLSDYYKEKTNELAFPPEKKEGFIAEVNKKQHQGNNSTKGNGTQVNCMPITSEQVGTRG